MGQQRRRGADAAHIGDGTAIVLKRIVLSHFSAIPIPDPTVKRERIVLQGSIPSPANPPAGCKFHTRCPYATERCKTEAPKQCEVEPGHYVVCHLYEK